MLPPAIESLSTAEKFDLLDELWADLEAHPPTLTTEQSTELDRRVEAYEQNKSNVIPWESVRADLFKQ